MAKSASGSGVNFADGLESEEGAVTVESRLFFDGTVATGATSNDLSRVTDARERGRIGIFGSALSYGGSYSRVSSESIGRDLNPLGTGAGTAAVGGSLNLGQIAPTLPGNSIFNAAGGNSVNNGAGTPLTEGGYGSTGTGGGGTGGSSDSDSDSDCKGVCHGMKPPTKKKCEDARAGSPRLNNCWGLTMATNPLTIDCRSCLAPWQEEWCEDDPNYGMYTGLGGGGTDGGGGTFGPSGAHPVPIGGTTGPWGPGVQLPKPALPGGWGPAAPGGDSWFQSMFGGGNGRGGLFGPGAYQLLGEGKVGASIVPAEPWQKQPTGDSCVKPGVERFTACCCKCTSCNNTGKVCAETRKMVEEMQDASGFNFLVSMMGGWILGAFLVAFGVGALVAVAIMIAYALITLALSHYYAEKQVREGYGKEANACYNCIRDCMHSVFGVNSVDEYLSAAAWAAVGSYNRWYTFIGGGYAGTRFGTTTWDDWFRPYQPNPYPLHPAL